MKRPHPLFFLCMIVALTMLWGFNLVTETIPEVSILSLTIIIGVIGVPLFGIALMANRIFECSYEMKVSTFEIVYNSFMLFIIFVLHWAMITEVIQEGKFPKIHYNLYQAILNKSLFVSQFMIFISGILHSKCYELDQQFETR